MTLYEVSHRAYCIYLHFKPNDRSYNAIKERFTLSEYQKEKALPSFINSNKHNLMKYLPYSKRDVTMFLVYNQWKHHCLYSVIAPPESSGMDVFLDEVIYYQNHLLNDLRLLYGHGIEYTSQELWSFYTRKEIHWYTLFYLFKFLGTDTRWVEDITIKPRVEKIGLTVQFFGFDEDVIRDIINGSDLKKKIELVGEGDRETPTN